MSRIVIGTIVAGLFLASNAPAQKVAKIRFRDHSAKPERVADVTGTILAESINGIKLKPPVGADREILVPDIVEVQYDPPTELVIPMNRITKLENDLKKAAGAATKKHLSDLDQEYKAALNAIKSEKSILIKRQIQYRIAQLQALSANDAVDLQLQAIEALDKFRKENANAWETIPAVREQVQMLVALNKLDDAAKVLDDVSKVPNLAKRVKQDLDFLLIDLMIRAGKLNEVEGRIRQALAVLPPNDPLAGRLKIYELGAKAAKGNVDAVVPQLKSMIETTSDSALKALAYNTLGDCYNSQSKKKEAMWAYLWVDVVYNQDKSEHLKALERLVRVFKDLGDDAHADKYRGKLKSLR